MFLNLFENCQCILFISKKETKDYMLTFTGVNTYPHGIWYVNRTDENFCLRGKLESTCIVINFLVSI